MKSPEFVFHAGRGIFSFHGSVVKSSFALYRNPYWVGVIAEEGFSFEAANNLIQKREPVQLTGILNDGRAIKADDLYITNVTPPENDTGVEFTAIKGVSLGQAGDIPPIKSIYPMTGCFKGQIALIHDGWEINTVPCSEPAIAKNLAQKWHIPVEGMGLHLKCNGASMAQHQDFARVIMNLLSLALGTGVACDRHVFTWENDELEIWQPWTGDEIGPGAIIPDFRLNEFLEQTLPVWQLLSQEQQKALRLARDYINLSGRGYLDTRLLQIFQPWEFLVEAWGVKGNLSDSECDLRSRLQQARKLWNHDHANCEVHGFWGSRISLIFEWPKLKDAIIQLATFYDLNLELLGLDLNLLNEARNSVAHLGKLDEPLTGSKKRASLDLLEKSQYCLQLLILRILKYQGLVCHSENRMRRYVDIEYALRTPRN